MSSSANCEVFTHDLLCRIKQKRYHSHREKSRASPDKYMTLIVDGMDQAKTNIPYTKVATESTSSLWRLREDPCIWDSYPHESTMWEACLCVYRYTLMTTCSNLTATLLVKALLKFTEDHQLPENLYIQMDNPVK